MQDCSDVMQLLLKTQTEWSDLPEDDPQVRACAHARVKLLSIRPVFVYSVYSPCSLTVVVI